MNNEQAAAETTSFYQRVEEEVDRGGYDRQALLHPAAQIQSIDLLFLSRVLVELYAEQQIGYFEDVFTRIRRNKTNLNL